MMMKRKGMGCGDWKVREWKMKKKMKKKKNEGVWIVEFMRDEQHTQDVEEDENESMDVKQSRERE